MATGINRKFGKLVNGELVYAPQAVVVVTRTTRDVEVCINAEAVEASGAEPIYETRTEEVVKRRMVYHPTASDYLNAEDGPWLPIVDRRPATDSAHYAVATGYALSADGASIVRVYEVREVETPPRTFSKLRAIGALKQAGVWAQVKAWIEANDLMDEYLAAQDFREDNEYFVRGLGALKEQLGWSDEQVEAVLSACVAQ